MRITQGRTIACVVSAIILAGCEAEERGQPIAPEQAPLEDTHVEEPQVPVQFGGGGEPRDAVIHVAGARAVDAATAPEEGRRRYVYDPGFPPGTYFSEGFYYYGGYRYPENAFVSGYVQPNISQQRFVNVAENRRVAQELAASQRPASALNRGVGQGATAARNREQTTVQQQRTAQPNLERHEITAPARSENQPANQPAEIRAPVGGEHEAIGERPANRTQEREQAPARAEVGERKVSPAKPPAKPGAGEAGHEAVKK